MKKFLALFLALLLVLGLCACNGSDAKAKGLHVGYSKQNLTPDFPVGLGGYADADTRKSQGVVSYVYLTCIAMSEDDNTVLLFTVDMGGLGMTCMDALCRTVSEGTGIPKENIFFGATHTHSGPSYGVNDANGGKFDAFLLQTALAAGKAALEDLSPATTLVSKTNVENMNFVRHYKMSDGSYAGANFGSFTGGVTIVDHATATDPQLTLVKFDRADDKKDVLLVNWQAHPASGSSDGDIGYNNISADFVGALRDRVEMDTGLQVAYFTGAGGNQNRSSKIQEEDPGLGTVEYGEKMGEYAVAALENLTPVEGSGIKSTKITFTAENDHTWDHMLDEAKQVVELKKTGVTSSAANDLARTLGFSSWHHARQAVSKASKGPTTDLTIGAFRVGGIGFISGGYEMFSDAGLYIKENSPYETTILVTGNSGYIPTAEAYDYGSYEAHTGSYAKGTAEKLAEEFVRLLGEVK